MPGWHSELVDNVVDDDRPSVGVAVCDDGGADNDAREIDQRGDEAGQGQGR